MSRDNWNGRPVKLVEFSIRDGRVVNEAFERDNEEGAFAMLVLSLRYADDDQPVFASVDDVYAQPYRLRERLAYLASKAAFVNGLRVDDPDAPPSPEVRANGHAESAGPSH